MFKIKRQNQPRHPLTCDFFFFLQSPDVSWDRGVWADRQGGKEEGGVLLLAHSCSRVVVEAD